MPRPRPELDASRQRIVRLTASGRATEAGQYDGVRDIAIELREEGRTVEALVSPIGDERSAVRCRNLVDLLVHVWRLGRIAAILVTLSAD